MTPLQAFVTILCALIAVAGVITSSILGYKQFKLKRQDEIEANDVQKRIDEAVLKAKEEMLMELAKVSKARSEEGAERFNTHAEAFKAVDKRIEENTMQIRELTRISKEVLGSMETMGKKLDVVGDSNRNNNYDRLLIVTNKILKSGKMTITDKTNLRQLYKSWKALGGSDDEMDTKYDECMEMEVVFEQ